MTACELKAFHDRTVSITFFDGENATAHLTCSDEDCADVMVDIMWTNRPGRYPQAHACSYIVPAAEIVSIAEISTGDVPQTELPDAAPQMIEPLTLVDDATEAPLAA